MMAATTILSIISNLFGFLGTGVIFFYGVPRQIDTGGEVMLRLCGVDEDEKMKIKKYKIIGNVGLGMIGFSFLIQMASNVFF